MGDPALKIDTVRDIEPPSDARRLLDAVATGTTVERTHLVRELERMLRQVAQTDADFDSLGLLFKRKTTLVVEVGPGSDVHDAYELDDNTVVLQTSWFLSARSHFRRRLADDLAPWVVEHDDPRGIPCFRARQIDVVLAATSYEDALYLLGDDVVWVELPDCLAETQGDPDDDDDDRFRDEESRT